MAGGRGHLRKRGKVYYVVLEVEPHPDGRRRQRWMLDGMRPEDAAVLVVTGDCLRGGDDIRSGDRVIIDTTIRTPANGEIVAVRVNGEETLKHYHRFSNRVELRPSTDGYIPIVMYEGQGEVEIIGVYVGMLRRARRGGR